MRILSVVAARPQLVKLAPVSETVLVDDNLGQLAGVVQRGTPAASSAEPYGDGWAALRVVDTLLAS